MATNEREQMGGIAGADLAIAVSKAGGLGQVGADLNLKWLSAQLSKAEQALGRQDGLLPIGVGLLTFVLKDSTDEILALLQQFQPAVVWLFAANELNDYAAWAAKIRDATPRSQIWVQVGSVDGALTVAKTVRPDALCLQGLDAGGHGFEKGAGGPSYHSCGYAEH